MKRLVKVAKELNVGTTTIVEHLEKSGFSIANRPTSKVSDEMYEVLLRDFKGSIAIKEKADQLTIGLRERKAAAEAAKEAERKAAEEVARKKAEEARKREEELKKEAEELRQKEEARKREEERKRKEEEERKRKEEEEARKKAEAERIKLAGPKVVDKVNLDEINPPKPKKSTPPAKEEKAKKPVAKQENNKAKEDKKHQHKSKKAKKVSVPKKETIKKETPPKKENTENTEDQKTSDDEVIRVETPQLKGLKIKGRIDLNRFNKPKKKKEDTDNKKTEAKKVAKNTNKEGGEKKDDSGKKRRRKRKKIVKPTSLKPGEQQKSDGQDRKEGQKVRKTPVNRVPRERDNKRRRSKRRVEPEQPKEISKKDIEDKIKATMARMSGGSKNKRSKIRRENRVNKRIQQEQIEQEEHNEKLQVTEFISVSELASVMDVSVAEVITTCFNMGVIVSINQRLDAEVIEFVANEFGHEVEFISAEQESDIIEDDFEDDPADLIPRAPIVTVMGHVDHGKTSLLDYIRSAKVAEGEAGGITQHIGAYEVNVEGEKITFLDTPGHEAFTAMRARGAKVTDVAIIIVAADDSIMPQTKEAISHAEAAGVPIVFAINKIDKPGADPNRIKQQLAEMNYLVEEWGGKYQSQDISAKFGTNIDELLQLVILEAGILELQANPKRPAIGVVLEASLDKGRGYVTKLLVENGTLNVGDPIVAGSHSGKVRAMFNERGKRVKTAGPAAPVLMLGLSGAPQAGEKFKEMESEQEARQLATRRAQLEREQQQRATRRISLEDIGRRLALGNFQELNIIVKGDVDGSIEALSDSLLKLSIESIQVNIIHRAVGQIKESDILLASASDAIVVGFQVRPSNTARQLAEKEGVEIKLYSVIYDAIEEVKSAIEGMLEPTKEEKILGTVEVREVYKISKVGTVAGSFVQDGKITRNSLIRVIRDGIVVYPTKEGVTAELGSLKRFKEDVKEVRNGFECGLTVKNYNDIKPGDLIEAYEIIEIKQTLS